MATVSRGKIVLVSIDGKRVRAHTKLFLARVFMHATDAQIEAKINNTPAVLADNVPESVGRKLAAGLKRIGAAAEFIPQPKVWKSDQAYRQAVPVSEYYDRSKGDKRPPKTSQAFTPQSIFQWQRLKNMVVLCFLAMLTVITIYGLTELMVPQDRIYDVTEIIVPRVRETLDADAKSKKKSPSQEIQETESKPADPSLDQK